MEENMDYTKFIDTYTKEEIQLLKELDVDIKSDENKLNQSSISEEKRAHIEANLKEERRIREIIANTKEEDMPNIASANLYDVDIPDDNGSNYLEWEKKPSNEVATKIIEGIYGLDDKTLDDMCFLFG